MTRIHSMLAAAMVMAAWSPFACSLAAEPARERATLKGHDGPVRSVSWSPDGKTLASASGDGTVKLWDVSPRK